MLNREARGRCAGDAREMRGRGAGDTRGNAWKTHGRCSGFVQKMHRRPTGGAWEMLWRGAGGRCSEAREDARCWHVLLAVSVSFEGEECDAAEVNVGRSTKGHHHTTHFLSRAQIPASSLSSVPKLPSTPVSPAPWLPASSRPSRPQLQYRVPRTMAPSILSVLQTTAPASCPQDHGSQHPLGPPDHRSSIVSPGPWLPASSRSSRPQLQHRVLWTMAPSILSGLQTTALC
nr:uncharacterized protein LOC107399506 [Peromyscus maniculatus bairdii]